MGSVPSSALLSRSSDPTNLPRSEDFGGIDASVRLPVLTLLAWGAIWLLVGLTLSLISAWKLHAPEFLGNCAWLTLGRIDPAATSVLVYGWGFNAALAVAFWMLGRLSGSAIRSYSIGTIAILFWNLAVAGGLLGILAGDTTSVPWLEIPGYVSPVLLVSFIVLGAWLVGTLRDRLFPDIFISQWYIIGGIFWFAWLYSAAQLMLIYFPVRGTVQAIVSAWYSHGLFSLWFGAIALAALYYFLPKLSGRPVRHYYLATLGFWSFAALNGWLGVQHLAGGPVPAWVQTIGIAAALMSLVPISVITINILGSLGGSLGAVKESLVLRFMMFSAVSFTISSIQLVLSSFGRGAELTHFTYAGESQGQLWFLGFFTMAIFGAIYYIVPRLVQKPWASPGLIGAHFVGSAAGIILIYGALLLAGFKQSADLHHPDVPFVDIVGHISSYLLVRLLGLGLLTLGQVAFVVNLLSTLVRPSERDAGLLVLPQPPELEAAR